MTDAAPEFPTGSTYRAPFDVTDRNNDPLDLSTTEVRYAISEGRAGDELFRADETDTTVEVEPDGETGRIRVTIPASQLTWTGTVIEELRLTRSTTSLVVSQRPVTFVETLTDPE